jgi:hypothetical protein
MMSQKVVMSKRRQVSTRNQTFDITDLKTFDLMT